MHPTKPCLAASLLLLWLGSATLAPRLAAQDSPRLVTSRTTGSQLLKLPKEDDAFGFVVFGDRTGGPVEGIKVLAQAVTDTNLLDPDLVLTVGDLVNGYNTREPWLAQAAEYKETMARLRMPWFPVAGNHDVYWRGEGKPKEEHEGDYEQHFGPLWYAVQHKHCWFVVLYSDEANPETGERNFSKPECQRIGDEQFAWLRDTLQKAKGARHVFVFLHHPRWLQQYGDDWQKVHAALAANGNVSAVFAGHIHNMQFDGVRDGIAYYTVASVGAHLAMEAPQAGFLHQYHVVTVRPEGIQVAAVPVGAVIDPHTIDGAMARDVRHVHEHLTVAVADAAAAGSGAAISVDGAVDAVLTLRVVNPGQRALELELIPEVDGVWQFGPDHQHLVVPPGKSGETTFAVRRAVTPEPFSLPQLEVRCDYLAEHSRVPLPIRSQTLQLPAPAGLGKAPSERDGVLVLDGVSALAVDSARLELPDGPITLETWLRGDEFSGRRGLIAKTENSEFGLFCSDGTADWSVHLDGHYVRVSSEKKVLQEGVWHHVAGVYDGAEVRIYVDGKLLAKKAGSGVRTQNQLPLMIGADVNKNGGSTSGFHGRLDDVRLSKVARYTGESFTPPQKLEADADTVLLLPCDEDFGPWAIDRSGRGAHPTRRGTAHCTAGGRESGSAPVR
ncbi:MAG: metallophosphoesterase [Planctomycetes bacterium]|nr:metallophosphoesterase [Planctomycetota bacterium]